MPWRLRRTLGLILVGCTILAVSVVVLILNQDTSTELLGVVGVLGGLAVIVTALPADGEPQP